MVTKKTAPKSAKPKTPRRTLSITSTGIAAKKLETLDILDAIGDEFRAIGTTKKPTVLPVPKSNVAKEAVELATADRLLRLATNRREQAIAEARRVGILNDLHSYPVGKTRAFTSDSFDILVQEEEGGQIIDRTKLELELRFLLGATKTEWVMSRVLKDRDGNTTVLVHYKH